jgi:hypothetical protein
MSMADWFPALTTTGLLGFALWLSRTLISTRLKESVKSEFDEKLEGIRTSFRNSEELFKADLRAKEAQLEALKNSAMSGLTSRQAELDKRRIKAVEQLWSMVIDLSPAKRISANMTLLKYDNLLEEAPKNPKVQEFVSIFGSAKDVIGKMNKDNAAKVRPFVSDIAWALFSAYHATVSIAVIRLGLLQRGIEKDLVDVKAVAELLKTALPHQADFIDNHDASAYHHLLDELENFLLWELRNTLRGVASDKESIEQAAEIIKVSNRVMESISQTTPT